ncbi:hypothetical protein Tco_0991765 [Tanacetum coccineum]|uniref:SMP-LTD domain-containing protein n=1 Tax=Tanacetum coccineum TaxID=301880 RepID=A0ABQ5F042_9ASTR
MVTYVDVLFPRMLDIIAAESISTSVITKQRYLIEGEAVVSKLESIQEEIDWSPSFFGNLLRMTAEQFSFKGVLANSLNFSLFPIKVFKVEANLGMSIKASEQHWAQDLDYETEFEQQEVGRLRCFVISGGIVPLVTRCHDLTAFGPWMVTPLRVVIPFKSSFGLVLEPWFCMFLKHCPSLAVDISFKIVFGPTVCLRKQLFPRIEIGFDYLHEDS